MFVGNAVWKWGWMGGFGAQCATRMITTERITLQDGPKRSCRLRVPTESLAGFKIARSRKKKHDPEVYGADGIAIVWSRCISVHFWSLAFDNALWAVVVFLQTLRSGSDTYWLVQRMRQKKD